MYLSRIQLTESIGQHSQLGLILKDRSYGMHRLLWDLFSDGESFLFREESSREQLATPRNRPLYYLLSQSRPDSQSPIFQIETKEYSPNLKARDQLAFRLRANPTIARKTAGKKNSVRHDVLMDAQQQWLRNACEQRSLSLKGTKGQLKRTLLSHPDFSGSEGHALLNQETATVINQAAINWLKQRSEINGFDIDESQIEATGYRWNALPEKGRHAGFSSMDYEGVLTVTDPVRFLQRIEKGFGPAKAFGCGLMLIRRL